MRSRLRAALRLTLIGALALVGLPLSALSPAQAAQVPFSCVPKFYQVSATNSGGFFVYDAASNSMSRVGTGSVSSINGIGYNTADNFIYGVSGTKLYRLDSTGTFSAGTTITGTAATSGGDFYGGKLITAPNNSNSWTAIDVGTATATSYALTSAANGFASAGTWAAYDLTVQGNVAYGLNNQTLYIVKMDTKQVSTRTVTGPSNGNYGAAYSDASGNAFFYNNSDNKVFMLPAAQLAAATGSATAPVATLVGGTASTPALSAPNDGASCPNAVSPYAPTVDDDDTDASADDTTATLSGTAAANNTTTTLSFCYGTDPALATCTTVGATPGTISGTTPTGFTAGLSELEPGTTYYYQVVATNSVGTNRGEIKSFTTTGGGSAPLAAQTITFQPPSDMRVGDAAQSLTATATSGLTVSFSTASSACSVSGSQVTAVSTGSCVIAADQAGDSSYAAAAQATRTIEIGAAPDPDPLSQAITFTAPSAMTVGDAAQSLTATATSGLTVSFSTASAACSVSGTQVTAIGAGTCEIAADQAGDATYAAAPQKTRSFTVSPAPEPDPLSQTIAFTAPSAMTLGDSAQSLSATATSGLDVTYTSLTPAVCSVSAGTVSPVTAGSCEVAADQAGDATYAAATRVTRTFAVARRTQSVSLSPLADTVFGASDPSVSATATSGLPVSVTTSTPQVCTASDSAVHVLMPGTCTVVATQAGNATYAAATPASVSFVVAKGTQTVRLGHVDDIKVGQGPAHVTVTTSRPVTAVLASQTPAVCTAGADGSINLVAAGTCTVRASVAEDEGYRAAADSVTFTVLPDLVVAPPTPVTTTPGSSTSISIPATSGVSPFTWSVSDVAGNTLPDGLVLDPATGQITGSVLRPGRYAFDIIITDATGERVSRTVTLTVDSTLSARAPHGRRTVVAGGRFALPMHATEIDDWSYDLPSGLSVVRTAGGQVWIRTAAGTSGRYDVPLTVTDGVSTLAGSFRVTVLPRPVASGAYRLGASLVSRVGWTPRHGAGVRGYRVYVDGRPVGRTSAPHLSLARPLGPGNHVTVRTEGNDGLLSAPRRLRYVAPADAHRAQVAAVVYFGSSLANLDAGDRSILDDLGAAVRAAGFRHLEIVGFTDSRGSVASNLALSERRARAVRTFLGDRLPGRGLAWAGRSESAPVASNSTAAGQALNRRVEIRVW